MIRTFPNPDGPEEWSATSMNPGLVALGRTQTQDEIAQLLQSCEPLNALYDPTTHACVAAHPISSVSQKPTRQNTCLEPPCRIYSHLDSKACVTHFPHLGSRQIEIANSYQVDAGGRRTTVWYEHGDSIFNITTNAASTTAFTRPLTLVRIERHLRR